MTEFTRTPGTDGAFRVRVGSAEPEPAGSEYRPGAGAERVTAIRKDGYRWDKLPSPAAAGMSTGEDVRTIMTLYAANVWVFAGISRIAGAISGVRMKFFRTSPGGKRTLARDTALQRLLETPNPFMTWEDLVERTVVDLKTGGWCAWEKLFPDGSALTPLSPAAPAGQPLGVWRLRPDRFSIEPDPETYWRGLRVRSDDGGEKVIPPEKLVMFRYWSPLSDYTPLSPLFAAQEPVIQELYARLWNRKFFEHGGPGNPEGVYESDQVQGDDEYKRLKESLRIRQGGPDSWRDPLILPPGLKFRETTRTQRDMQFVELLAHTRDEALTCCPAGTKVLTPAGPKRIEAVEAGDLVLTHRGRFRPVRARLMRGYSGTMYRLRGWGWNAAEFTAGHPVYTRLLKRNRSHRFEVRTQGAFVPVETLTAPGLKNSRRAQQALVMPQLSEVGTMTGFDLASFMAQSGIPVREVGAFFRPDFQSHRQFMPSVMPLDEEMGWLVGMFLAEGSASDHQTWFTLGSHETGFAQRIRVALMRAFSREASIKRRFVHGHDVHTLIVRLDSRVAARFFDPLGHDAGEKRLPDWWRFAPKDFLRGVFHGVLDGDGCSNPTRHNVDRWRLTTVSESLLWQMRLIGWTLGYSSSATIRKARHYRIWGYGDERWHEGTARSSFTCTFTRSGKHEQWRIADGEFLTPLRELRERTVSGLGVYNLSVEEDESFVTEAGAVHNCIGVPPAMVGIPVAGGLGSYREQRSQFYQNTVLPLLRKLAGSINRFLAPAGEAMEFDLQDILSLVEDLDAQTRTAESQVTRGLRTINEIRSEWGLEPLPWGEEWWAPLGLAPVSAAARPERPAGLESAKAPAPEGEMTEREAERVAKVAVWKETSTRLARRLARVWSAALSRVREKLVRAVRGSAEIEKAEPPETRFVRVDLDELTDDVAGAIRDELHRVAVAGQKTVAGELGVRTEPLKIVDPRWTEWFDGWRAREARLVVQSGVEVAERRAAEAAAAGQDLNEAARNVDRELEEWAGRVADAIGTTDATAAGNFGREAGMAEGGALWKQWLSVQIETTRRPGLKGETGADHYHRYPEGAHEQTVPVGKPFFLKNRARGLDAMQQPGDFAGADENVCGCACLVVPVDREDVDPETVPAEYRAGL